MTENTQNTDQGPPSADLQEKLIAEIKDLRDSLMKESLSMKNKAKETLKRSNNQVNQKHEELKTQLSKVINNYQSFSVEQLNSLKGSLESQIDSLRGSVTQIVDDDELKLVNSLEATLTNVTDIAGSQVSNLLKLINDVGEIANKSTQGSIEIAKDRDIDVKEELNQKLTLNKEDLSQKIIELQDNFRDEMNTKIEKVFMGVTMTKEGINGIIKDTLSRLEENLNRLTQGIDENFSKEVGEAQDLIHEYEGKLLEAIEETQEVYNSQMEAVLNKHSQQTQQSLTKLTSELNQFKDGIVSEISGLSKEQEELFANVTKQLESQIAKSKADVIESHKTLKNELGKLLKTNKERIEESISKLRKNNATQVDSVEKEISEKMKSTRQSFGQTVDETQKIVESTSDDMENHIKQSIQRAEGEINKTT